MRPKLSFTLSFIAAVYIAFAVYAEPPGKDWVQVWADEFNDHTVALRSNKNGKYLTVTPRTRFSLSATGRTAGVNEKFVFDIR